ncbi:hypothetical protein [Nitrosospira briensis]|uniref:hypothetical protein n=1 Tax=Nitrosospira briensis TaxID=35799 RepID=UPI00046A8F7C|nr:hypothetical protein [Nitrosospira briensis]
MYALRPHAPHQAFNRTPELFAGALICGENSPDFETIRKATLVDKLLDGLLFQCAAKRQPLYLLGFAAQLKTHAAHDTETLTQQLSQPYRAWQQKGEELRKAELNEYTNCNEMLEITIMNSAASTIIAINRSIAVAEQNLERMKARKNPNGTYEFDSNRLTCYRALSNYTRGTWEYEK